MGLRPVIAIFVLLSAVLIFALTWSGRPGTNSAPVAVPGQSNLDAGFRTGMNDTSRDEAISAQIVVEDRGTIGLELYPKAAPVTVARINELCRAHFYDNLKVHAADADHIQFGDPDSANANAVDFADLGIGTHGSGTPLPIEGKLPAEALAVGIAHGATTPGDSQIFITRRPSLDWNGKYTIFGRVIAGKEVLAEIKVGDRIQGMSVVH